jgi:hypothetical protein
VISSAAAFHAADERRLNLKHYGASTVGRVRTKKPRQSGAKSRYVCTIGIISSRLSAFDV